MSSPAPTTRKERKFRDRDLLRCYYDSSVRHWRPTEVLRCSLVRGGMIHDAGDFEKVDISRASGTHAESNYPIESMRPDLEFRFLPLENCRNTLHECEVEGEGGYLVSMRCLSRCAL